MARATSSCNWWHECTTVALLLLVPACSDDGFPGPTGQMPAGTGATGMTGALVTSADGDDGIDPSLPTATSPGTGDDGTGGPETSSGSSSDPTKSTSGSGSDGDAGSDDASTGTTAGVGGSSESGAPSDDGLTIGTGGTQETLEFSDATGLPTFGDSGTPATNCVSIDVPADGFDTVVSVELEAAFTHTWIGDVTIELVAPDRTTLTVLNRAGQPAMGDYGDDSDASPASPLSFHDDASTSAEQMGAMLGEALAVCAADAACDYFAAPDAAGTMGGVGTSFADFAGVAADGQWMVCFTDSADQDPLTVAGATLRITKSM